MHLVRKGCQADFGSNSLRIFCAEVKRETVHLEEKQLKGSLIKISITAKAEVFRRLSGKVGRMCALVSMGPRYESQFFHLVTV